MATPIISARNVTVDYRSSGTPALSDASLDIYPGEAVGIVGESGSGKTTLALVLAGAIGPTAGQVAVNGVDATRGGFGGDARRVVQMVFQNPYSALHPQKSALQAITEVYQRWHKVKPKVASAEATDLLARVGVRGDMIRRRPKGLSGGERQRIVIARALACDPDVIIADEPTASLDSSIQAQIVNLLLDLLRQGTFSLVLISHDLGVVRHVTRRAVVMYRGRVVERGSTEVLLTSPAHPYTDMLVRSLAPGEAETSRVPRAADGHEGCVFADRCPKAEDLCTASVPSETTVGEHSWACFRPIGYGAEDVP